MRIAPPVMLLAVAALTSSAASAQAQLLGGLLGGAPPRSAGPDCQIGRLVDGDQRAVVLPIVARGSNWVHVRIPASAAVVPAGFYMLFVERTSADGPIPSTSTPIHVPGPTGACAG
jgi:hypothetical protein